ncbi:leishmanolysin peptidase, putative [Ichthyophthirius multifiliis]|uniref:Leishmanolysin peptidase, putative n=1 Tax=Ichthyophthirius multifiliis TaxID=5932 RepID=G0QZA6_ICHMU|nr:leishmanolysin peptidase, putative [Ichthyophthirius multifiliis]EGR29446.1 leishmanolysin peptidase, putative [Ichthyophthirius multifiliis]|eukprot:XP_004030682.1 leishmanolysin peptidase, putative [Ichthyophthirius multifiliis]
MDIKKRIHKRRQRVKKEMFLVSMTHGIIEDEIKRLKLISTEKDHALLLSEKQLKQDHENFQKYLEQNKQAKLEAEQKANNVMKEKKSKESDIKQINVRLGTLRQEKQQKDDYVAMCTQHKEFLEKLTPKEWLEKKEKDKLIYIEKKKKEWIAKQQKKSIESDDQNEKESKVAGGVKKNSKNIQINDSKDKHNLEHIFSSQFENDYKLDFELNYEMYFKQPNQLVDYFDDLERKNIFQIQNFQEDQSAFDEFKQQFEREKDFLNQKALVLKQNKINLQKQVDEQLIQIKELLARSEDNKVTINNDRPELRKNIMDLYQEFNSEINLHDVESKSTLDILAQYKYILYCIVFDIIKFQLKKKKAEKDRKFTQKEQKQKEQQEDEKKKVLKNKQKITQPTRKKEGRIDMTKSAPLTKQKKKEVKQVNNEEEEDKKYFLEKYQFI